MSPLEQIEYGIINKDWEVVIEAYKNLTGKDIHQQEEYKNIENDEDTQIITNSKQKRGRPKKNIKTNNKINYNNKTKIISNIKHIIEPETRTGPVKARTMQIIAIPSTNIERAKDAPLYKDREVIVKGNRQTLVNQECSICNKIYKINPALITRNGGKEYVCDKCMVGR